MPMDWVCCLYVVLAAGGTHAYRIVQGKKIQVPDRGFWLASARCAHATQTDA